MKNLLIVDDHPLFLEGMVLLIHSMLPNMKIHTADTFTKAKKKLAKKLPDILLLDLQMPDQNGMESLKTLTRKYPSLCISVISSSESLEHMELSFAHGARGYISKTSSPQAMIEAIDKVLSGELHIPEKMLSPPSTKTEIDTRDDQKLSPRQLEILNLVSIGYTNKTIAETLFISEGTVKQHLSSIFKIINVKNRTQAAQYQATIDTGTLLGAP